MKKYERTVTEAIRENLLRNVDLIPQPTLEELRESEWSDEFEQLMRNRLIMGAFRYGVMSRPCVDDEFALYAIKRIKKYIKTGNTEFLVDAANLCLMEFERGMHPNKHLNIHGQAEKVKKTRCKDNSKTG